MNISLFILLIIIVINLYISSSNREYYQQVPLKQYEQEKDINIFSNSNSPQDTYQKFNIDITSSFSISLSPKFLLFL